MADRIVVNTGPLIAIGRVGALELLEDLAVAVMHSVSTDRAGQACFLPLR